VPLTVPKPPPLVRVPLRWRLEGTYFGTLKDGQPQIADIDCLKEGAYKDSLAARDRCEPPAEALVMCFPRLAFFPADGDLLPAMSFPSLWIAGRACPVTSRLRRGERDELSAWSRFVIRPERRHILSNSGESSSLANLEI